MNNQYCTIEQCNVLWMDEPKFWTVQNPKNEYAGDLWVKVPENRAVPSGVRLLGQNFISQQDNDPKHSSKLFKDYAIYKWKESSKLWMVSRNPWLECDCYYRKNGMEMYGNRLRHQLLTCRTNWNPLGRQNLLREFRDCVLQLLNQE